MPTIYHVHGFFMVLWVTMAIVQPMLVVRKKTRMHRLIGKISYGIMPVVFITAFLVIRHTYHASVALQTDQVQRGFTAVDKDVIRANAAAVTRLGFLYLSWLFLFYTLAVINRKKILPHATYMFAAILTILGPTADRLIGHVVDFAGLPYNALVENAVFAFNVLMMMALLAYQRRMGKSIIPATFALAIYIIGISLSFLLPGTKTWQSVVEFLMD